MLAALASPCRIKRNRLRWRRVASGRTVYGYVNGKPLRRIDPKGLEGIGPWTYAPGPQRDSYEASKRGENSSNFAIGLAITGAGIFAVNGEFGVATDTKCNACVYRKVCHSGLAQNFGAFAGAGLGGGFGQGSLSSGLSRSNLYVVEGGEVISAGGGVEIDQDTGAVSVGRGFFGAGEGAFAGKLVCETRMYCTGGGK